MRQRSRVPLISEDAEPCCPSASRSGGRPTENQVHRATLESEGSVRRTSGIAIKANLHRLCSGVTKCLKRVDADGLCKTTPLVRRMSANRLEQSRGILLVEPCGAERDDNIILSQDNTIETGSIGPGSLELLVLPYREIGWCKRGLMRRDATMHASTRLYPSEAISSEYGGSR